MKRGTWARWLPCLLGAASIAIPFYRVVFYSDRALFFRDLIRDFLAYKLIWVESVRHGDGIPLWNHFAFGGTPFLAMEVGSPLNPLNLLFLLFPTSEIARGLVFYLLAHYLLFFFGAYLLLRKLHFLPALAGLFASALTLSGYLVSAHSLAHIAGDAAAIPWLCWFWLNFMETRKLSILWLGGLALAWPIYAGDPQITYFLGLFSVLAALLAPIGPWKKRLIALFTLVSSSLLVAAWQMLPTLELVLESERRSLSREESLLFSFHPLRLLETVFPLFLGNRIGSEKFWAESLVNFPYKNPFIFSTYPCAVALLFFLHFFSRAPESDRPGNMGKALFAILGVGLLLSFGVFSPLPAYEFASAVVPFFGAFRYPERLAIWPMFALWALAALTARDFLENISRIRLSRFRLMNALLCASCLLFTLAIHLKWAAFPEISIHGIASTFIALLLFWGTVEFFRIHPHRKVLFVTALAAIHSLDLFFNQAGLVWDQSKYVQDLDRYTLAKEIKSSLQSRGEEIRHGAPFRLGSENFSALHFSGNAMNHISVTTFTALENLLPNTASLFGIEDISGYSSFTPSRFFAFERAAVRRSSFGYADFRFFHDLMGAYYVPERDEFQQVILKKNESAQPYIFSPERILPAGNEEKALEKLRAPEFRSNRDAIVVGETGMPINPSGYAEQAFERGNATLEKRNGREIRFTFIPQSAKDKQLVVINESYNRNWKARVNGEAVPTYLVNGWSMGVLLKRRPEMQPAEIELEYIDPLILIGKAATIGWFLLSALILVAPRFQLRREKR